MDRPDPGGLVRARALPGAGALVLDERRVGGLRAAPEHRRQGVADGAHVPAPDAGPLGWLDHHDLPRRRDDHLVDPVQVHVGGAHAIRPRKRAGAAGRPVGGILGSDQVLVRGEPHVADVDPAEQAVPIAVVGLALEQVVERGQPGWTSRHRVDLQGRAQHLLVQVVDLAVLDLEVAPEPAPQVARLRPPGRLGSVQQAGEDPALVGRQRPFAHLRVRGRGHVDAADRRVPLQPVRRRRGGEPGRVRLERLEEAVDPAVGAPAVLPRGGPRPELLAVVTHHPDPVALLGRVVAEVGDHVVDVAERDAVAKPLLRPEDRQDAALVVRGVRTP